MAMPSKQLFRLVSQRATLPSTSPRILVLQPRPSLFHSSINPRAEVSPNAVSEGLPRWQQTPPAMKAPHRSRPSPSNNDFVVNNDVTVLDEAYRQMLGEGGSSLLSSEVKWLAITHKSFDQGRRGFNDKLAWLGKRILELHTSLALLGSTGDHLQRLDAELHSLDSIPDSNEVPSGLENVSEIRKNQILDRKKLSELAVTYGIAQVTRWKPHNAHDLPDSGCEIVYSQSIYAIIGALALERGGEVAKLAAHNAVLRPLGALQYITRQASFNSF